METDDSFEKNVASFTFTKKPAEQDASTNLTTKEKTTLTGMVLRAMSDKGGVEYIKGLDDKDFIRLVSTAISAEAKVKVEQQSHENFLKLLFAKRTQMESASIRVLDNEN